MIRKSHADTLRGFCNIQRDKLCLDFLFAVFCKLLLEPILAVDKALNDEGNNIVAGCVYHCCRGIDEVADSQRDGEGDRKA